MKRFLVQIDLSGDSGMCECVIDEIVAQIAFADLEHVGLKVDSVEVLEGD